MRDLYQRDHRDFSGAASSIELQAINAERRAPIAHISAPRGNSALRGQNAPRRHDAGLAEIVQRSRQVAGECATLANTLKPPPPPGRPPHLQDSHLSEVLRRSKAEAAAKGRNRATETENLQLGLMLSASNYDTESSDGHPRYGFAKR
jgi:hypothetical protein